MVIVDAFGVLFPFQISYFQMKCSSLNFIVIILYIPYMYLLLHIKAHLQGAHFEDLAEARLVVHNMVPTCGQTYYEDALMYSVDELNGIGVVLKPIAFILKSSDTSIDVRF